MVTNQAPADTSLHSSTFMDPPSFSLTCHPLAIRNSTSKVHPSDVMQNILRQTSSSPKMSAQTSSPLYIVVHLQSIRHVPIQIFDELASGASHPNSFILTNHLVPRTT